MLTSLRLNFHHQVYRRPATLPALCLGLLIGGSTLAQPSLRLGANTSVVGTAPAQPTLRIGANTRLVGSGAARITYGGGALTNQGAVNLASGPLLLSGPTTYGGGGTAIVNDVRFDQNSGTHTLNSLLSVRALAFVNGNASLNTNGLLYLRTDLFPGAQLVVMGILTGSVQGLVTNASLTTGAVPYSSDLTVNVSGSVVRYQWQSSANNSIWADVPNATGATYSPTVSAPLYYRCRLTTTNSGYDQTTPARLLDYTGTPPGQTVCRNGRVVLTTAKPAARYEWYKNGQTAANKLIDVANTQLGTTTASLTLVSVQTSGTYYVKEIQANGSFAWSGPFAVTVDGRCTARMGLEEPRPVLSIVATPNPLEDNRLRADVTGAEGGPLTVQLVDMQGYVLHEQHWQQAGETESVSWDVSRQPGGLYILQALTKQQRHTTKVIKP